MQADMQEGGMCLFTLRVQCGSVERVRLAGALLRPRAWVGTTNDGSCETWAAVWQHVVRQSMLW